ncbi:hypothetical protein LTR53_006166 [Teratosphaeriaceae sp. CCFEE 6253]|nr:hypothetical protein LTR53_006166 [Teratosphaeriaceae sp. CCFEE 6253]
MGDPTAILKSLNEARAICLATPAIYPQVVPGVVPVVGPAAPLALRRWGADFLAETFASPVLPAEEKQRLALGVLDTLNGYLYRREEQGEEEDVAVVKSAVQCAASLYPLVFRHILSVTTASADAAEVWAKMSRVKSLILRTMDAAPAGVRICGIKFIARVVQVQTPGSGIVDPRRPEQNEISLALLPRDHAVLQASLLEAEASGLLDRLLGVLQENSGDALLVTATLAALAPLVQRRASIASKILLTALTYNPLPPTTTGLAGLSGKDKVAIRSTTRTTMSFLLNVLKRQPSHPLAQRLQQRTEQLRHGLAEFFSPTAATSTAVAAGEKRAPPTDQPDDGLDNPKRQRVEIATANGTAPQQPPLPPPPLPPGLVSHAQLFTLPAADPTAAGFHVQAIPPEIVGRLVPPLLASLDPLRLGLAIAAVQARLLEYGGRDHGALVAAAQAAQDWPGRLGVNGDGDGDGDPLLALEAAGQRAQEVNERDLMPAVEVERFELAAAPALTGREIEVYGRRAVGRVFGILGTLDGKAKGGGGAKKVAGLQEAKGFARLAGGGVGGAALGQEREGWVTLLIRLATRSTAFTPLLPADEEREEEGEGVVKQEGEDRTLAKRTSKGTNGFILADGIRQALLDYIMEDFRRRIDVAIAWLNEEWFADRLAFASPSSLSHTITPPMSALPNYPATLLHVLDTLCPYLDHTKDTRTLIRFLSEIPDLDPRVLDRVVKLADDPERGGMACQALLYLVMFRPPVREWALDAVEALWRQGGEAKGAAGKVLGRWRPGALAEGGKGEDGEMKAEAQA